MKAFIASAILVLTITAIPSSAEEIKLSTIVPDQQIVRGKNAAIGNTYRNKADTDVPESSIVIEGDANIDGAVKIGNKTAPEGKIIYDSGSHAFKYHNGTDWVPLGGGWVHSGDIVFQAKHPVGTFGSDPDVYRELDLSPYIGGARHALCYLQFSTAEAGNITYGVKPAGVGRANYGNPCETSGPSVAYSPEKNDKSFLVVETSSNGKVEWGAASGSNIVTVVLLGYVS